MVSSPSAAALAAENAKFRKAQHTMEKALKANHLTRQLQMRLQYARLKVEHGWQKQNLNEVENLYFHNSHLRGGAKLPSSTSVQPIMTTQPLLAPSSLLPAPTQFPNIGSIQNNTLLPNIPPPTTLSEPENPSHDIIQVIQAAVAHATASAPTPGAPINPSYPPQVSTHVDNPAITIIQPEALASLPPAPVHNPTPTTPTIPAHTSTSTLSTLPLLSPQAPTLMTNPPSSSTNHYPPIKLPRTRNNKHPAGPKGAHQNLTAKEMLDFASTSSSTLTYDSFWSAHSASTPSSSRSAISVATHGVVGLGPAFQNSGLLTNGFAGIDLSQFVNVSFAHTPTSVTTSVEHPRSVP